MNKTIAKLFKGMYVKKIAKSDDYVTYELCDKFGNTTTGYKLETFPSGRKKVTELKEVLNSLPFYVDRKTSYASNNFVLNILGLA